MTLYCGKNGVDIVCMDDIEGNFSVVASGNKTSMLKLARERNYAVVELRPIRYKQGDYT